MTGRLKDLTLNRDGSQNVTITVMDDFRERFDELKEKELDIEIKAHRKRRSRDANAYAWILCDKIAADTRVAKLTVYREAIKNIGGVSDTVCVKDRAVEKLRESWQKNGLGWMSDTMPSKIEGCTNVILYYGSSTYDTKQMSALIDHLIQDAQALGIETMTPKELEALTAMTARR